MDMIKSFFNDYVDYVKSSLLAKIILAGLGILLVLGIFDFVLLRNFIPTLYFVLLIILYLLILVLTFIIHYKKVKISAVIEVILAILMIFLCVTGFTLDDVSDDLTDTKVYEYVYVVALSDSKIEADDDFSKYTLAYASDDDTAYSRGADIINENDKKVKQFKPYKSTKSAYKAFKEGKVELLVLTPNTASDLDLMCTDDEIDFVDENYESDYKIIFSKAYELESADAKEVDISKEPFTLYLQGTDLSSGKNINSTGRGDVNILLTVNPKTKKINTQVIPRDLLVYIACRGGHSKLSYSGWWGGIGSSINSIEEYFGVTINYYAKINFTGLMDLVDALGGVEVYSNYAYSADLDGTTYSWKKGYNKIKTGHEALIFARARKMLPNNERSRGLQQMELIKAIFKKFQEEPTYDHAMSILNALKGNFTTNYPKEDFSKAIDLVIKLLPQLTTMESHSMEGKYIWQYDEVRTTYYQYYFKPKKGEKKKVVNRINKVLEGK